MITGPVYAPIYVNGEWVYMNRTIGTFPKLVHVPTHFYKVIIGVKKTSNSAGKNNQLPTVTAWIPRCALIHPLSCYSTSIGI